MTNQETNEAVASKLGLTMLPSGNPPCGCWVNEYKSLDSCQYEHEFHPATDPAAAEWALGQSLPEDTWVHIEWYVRRERGKFVYRLTINGETTEKDTFCGCICAAILGAGIEPKKEETSGGWSDCCMGRRRQ